MSDKTPEDANVDGKAGRRELAGDRTEWAQQRTLLAKERTFSAWIRTGISSMIAGLGISEFLTSVAYPWLARILAIILILAGGTIYAIGFFSYRKALKELADLGIRSTSLWMIGAIAFLLIMASGITLFIIITR
ncbi:MAG: YidH family protein [Cytophagaceae bacterium]